MSDAVERAIKEGIDGNEANSPADETCNGETENLNSSSILDDSKSENDEVQQDSHQQQHQDSPQQQEHTASTNGGGRSGSNNNNTANVCRDFLNNVCFRGSRCKYFHPPEMGGATDPKKEEFKFCNDFQNRGCNRENCRYVHCTRADVDDYEQTGRMSESLARAIVAVTGQESVAGRPLCKEYLSGSCSRGLRCRFWHINPRDERERRMVEKVAGVPYASPHRRGGGPEPSGGRFPPPYGGGGGGMMGGGGGHGYDYPPVDAYDYRRDAKRARFDADPFGRATSPASYAALAEENAALRRKVEMMKATISDLTASNDTLLAENARLRAKTATTAASVTDQAIVAASMASAAALNSVLSNSTQALLSTPQASGITPEQLAVSLAAAVQQPMIVHPSIAISATPNDVVHWSLSQIRR